MDIRDAHRRICPEPLCVWQRVLDGITWTNYTCSVHGTVWTFADAGELDLGIVDPLEVRPNTG